MGGTGEGLSQGASGSAGLAVCCETSLLRLQFLVSALRGRRRLAGAVRQAAYRARTELFPPHLDLHRRSELRPGLRRPHECAGKCDWHRQPALDTSDPASCMAVAWGAAIASGHLGCAIAFGGVAVAVVDPTVAVPGKYRCSMVAMLLSYCPQHGAPVSRPIVPPTGIASYGKFEFGVSMAPTVQNCSTSACFERVALGRLLQGLCGSRFTAVCGDSPGLTRHGSQSALVFANDQPWTKPIQRTFWKIR